MRFHAKYVSVGEFGDEYFEVSFDSEDPGNDDLDLSGDENPYLIVQRQFEDGDTEASATSRPTITTPILATSGCGSYGSRPRASPSRSPGRTISTSR
jgi:hypothetical protein